MKIIRNSIIIIIFIITSPIISNAQKEGNFWYFGAFAGIDFNSGIPVAVTNGQLSTFEGCATISDNLGNLLFYTDGVFVWNKNHVLMPNGTGLLGDPSSTQSSIIVKKPGSNTIYYIFTADREGSLNGFRYTEVDMSLQGGLGDINLIKNILVTTPITENLCAVKHQNNSDFWIVTHVYNGSNTFHSYLLSSTGLNPTPVVTNIGINVTTASAQGVETIGYLRASADGSRLAVARWTLDNVDLFDFNNTTGVLSNAMSFSGFNGGAPPFYGGPYGVEFSPNGNLLYVSENYTNVNNIYQYNLLAGSVAAINASRIIVGTPPPGTGGALQLAPDQKIYNTYYNATALNVINSPNIQGLGCTYVANAFPLGGPTGTLGLPTFVNSINTSSSFTATNFCFGDSTFFSISTSSMDSVLWNFGDPNSGVNNTSTDTLPYHIFTDTGTFNIILITYSINGNDTTTNQIVINPIPTIYLGNDTSICQGNVLTLDATTSNANYLWYDNSTNPTSSVTNAGSYWVEITVNSCSASDTIIVSLDSIPIVDLGNDTILPCFEEDFMLSAFISNGNYLWQDNSTGASYTITEEGTYWVEVSNSCGSVRDTVIIGMEKCPITLEMPNVFTPNGDGKNDLFIPIIMEGIQDANITIYNRWGQELYNSSDITIGWNGNCGGGDCTDGTYYWIVNYTDVKNNTGTLKGFTSLLK